MHDLDAEDVVGLGVAVGGERDGDDLAAEPAGRGQAGPDQGDRAEGGRAVADERQQHERAVEPGQLGQLGLVERVGDRDERARRRTARAPRRARGRAGGTAPYWWWVEDLDLAGRRS